ncbi:MAG: zinc dependent phospholipase C family protein [Kiritimatiellae bacterium]|nr:zinc dependent phospholipase C family protein [Kiritimatiellia bacterium]
MMTEATTYGYTPVDPGDPVLPVDTRPRTVVKTLDGVECERTYYVYSPLTNIVERAGTQGAPYGGTNALRTVTAFYSVTGGSPSSAAADGRIASVRHEDGRLDLYDYALVSNLWTETVTHLHEQSPAPVSGKTTRDVSLTNARGEVLETRTEAYIDGMWYTISRNLMTYNAEGKRTSLENLAGQVTTTAWDCCHEVSEIQPDGSTTIWDYDADGRVIATMGIVPLDLTNFTWRTFCYAYDSLGRQIASWTTNYAAHVGLPATRTCYDSLGRISSEIDDLGNETTVAYDDNRRGVTVQYPNGSTRIVKLAASGSTIAITGTAVMSEHHAYSVAALPGGSSLQAGAAPCFVHTVRYGTSDSPRFVRSYENMLGQVVREECSGYRGAILATTYEYDTNGRIVRIVADGKPTVEYVYDVADARLSVVISADGQWRMAETASSFELVSGDVWLVQTNVATCSDASIEPLASSSSRQLTGLTASTPAHVRATDIRGNKSEGFLQSSGSLVFEVEAIPYASNRLVSVSRYGEAMQEVSLSCVTNTYAYDFLGRCIARTDGCGNVSHTEYNSVGQISASVDALGNRTTFAYNQFGDISSIADPLGHVTVFEYDLLGRIVYEGGATYPVRYTYDAFGNKATMTTYRNELLGPDSGDVTTWFYDEASNCMTNKVYADGNGPTYDYASDGSLIRRTCARGVTAEYSYDGWGNLTNTVYSDGTTAVAATYDAFGRQVETRDEAGVTILEYDAFGSRIGETVVGAAGTNTIERFYDAFGRDAGYALNGTRQSSLAYDPATGRLSSMEVPLGQSNNPDNQTIKQFFWSYLPGSGLKASLTYPNGLVSSWQYDAESQLLQVRNAAATNVISRYDYAYDAAGRRTQVACSGSAMRESRRDTYRYNNRDELISASRQGGAVSVPATTEYAYQYDDIGNRITSTDLGTNRTYTANAISQYSAVAEVAPTSAPTSFTPQYDADGNQTLIKTATGIWSVTYNAENRPVRWTCGETNVVMAYDRLGRRVRCLETCGAVTNADETFAYDRFLCVARHRRGVSGAYATERFVWEPSGFASSRPLAVYGDDSSLRYYTHDGRKNVSEMLSGDGGCCVSAHYEYAPFGGLSAMSGAHAADNPWRFSSEYADDAIGCVYYNYRHLDPSAGRWTSFDALEDLIGPTRYLFMNNRASSVDHLGLYEEYTHFYMIAWLASQFIDPMDAKALAYGSQYPDTEDWDPIRNAFAKEEVYHPISQLHNLNGFSRDEVKDYRCCVLGHYQKCMKDALKKPKGKERREKLFECGVLLHVLGDTYAHTKPGDESKDDDAGSSFKERVGHLFYGTAPDNPSNDLGKYSKFIDDASSVFPDAKARDKAKKRILDMIKQEQQNNRWWRFGDKDYVRAVKSLAGEVYHFDYKNNGKKLTKPPKPSKEQLESGKPTLREKLNKKVKDEVLPKLNDCYRKLGR